MKTSFEIDLIRSFVQNEDLPESMTLSRIRELRQSIVDVALEKVFPIISLLLLKNWLMVTNSEIGSGHSSGSVLLFGATSGEGAFRFVC